MIYTGFKKWDIDIVRYGIHTYHKVQRFDSENYFPLVFHSSYILSILTFLFSFHYLNKIDDKNIWYLFSFLRSNGMVDKKGKRGERQTNRVRQRAEIHTSHFVVL